MSTRIDVARAQQLVKRGAKFVDVLPASIYDQVHLPDAMSLPLETLTESSIADLDRDKAYIVYCFDQHCDLSARAASRLDHLGFSKIHDLIGGRAAWTVLGLPTQGQVGDARRISHYLEAAPSVNIEATIADVVAVAVDDWPVAVVSDDGVLLGAVADTARGLRGKTPVRGIMITAPSTIRPEERVDDVVAQLQKDKLDRVYVTTASGVLLGIVIRDAIHV